jgi:tetratricopeptide (TPR) repeat protein
MNGPRTALALLLATAPAAQDPAAAQRQLAHLDGELAEASARTARLIDLRVRHDLGLRIEAESWFALSDAERETGGETGKKLLEQLHVELERLIAQHSALERAVEVARRSAAEHAVAVHVEAAGSLPSVAPAIPPDPAPAELVAPPTGPRPAEIERLPASRPRAVLVKGSIDHGLVGRSLFAAKRYAEAKAELELVCRGPDPEFTDQFLLARCHERLGETEAARKLYLQIEARDTKEGGPAGGGPWAQSARTARRAMTWVADRGLWQPPAIDKKTGARKGGK